MRNLIVAVCLALGISACNTQNAVKENSSTPEKQLLTMADVIPVKQPKSQQQKVSQQKFLKENTKRFKSKTLAGKYYVIQAQRAFNEQKLDSAMLLFGRAWLMDSTNNDILWGYGKIYGEKKMYDKAIFVLYRALDKDKNNPRLLTDVATSHLNRFYETSDPADLMQSKKLLKEAIVLKPNQTEAYYKLAINSYYLKEYDLAWDYLHKSITNTKAVTDKTFVAALLDKQKDPKGIYTRASIL
jgi:tetratricopeptide (TPR) repeat protein